MKRFILITAIGAAALLGSTVSLSLGLYPDQLSSFGVLAQGCIVLVLGTSLFASGMLGLAENYEKTASQLFRLLRERQHPGDDPNLVVPDEAELARRSESFWSGYQKTAAGMVLFLGGFLSLMVSSGKMSLSVYMVAVVAGAVAFGVAAILLTFKGLAGIRHSHAAIASSLNSLASQPPADMHQFPPRTPGHCQADQETPRLRNPAQARPSRASPVSAESRSALIREHIATCRRAVGTA